jgi:hypothetical protein
MTTTQWQQLLWFLGLLSLATFVTSLLVIPWLIGRLDTDYFSRHQEWVARRRKRHPALWLSRVVMRNTLGIVLLIAGVAMLILPGQGLLTILIGLALLDFPGKFELISTVARLPKVSAALQWIRKKQRVEPFTF